MKYVVAYHFVMLWHAVIFLTLLNAVINLPPPPPPNLLLQIQPNMSHASK